MGSLIVLMCGAVLVFAANQRRESSMGVQEMTQTDGCSSDHSYGYSPSDVGNHDFDCARCPANWAWSRIVSRAISRSVVTQRYTGWKATLTEDPHNQYLLILAETGLLGLAAFAWFLVFRASTALRRGRFDWLVLRCFWLGA